uniref:DNA-directed RNA polymerase III subunit RPC9 n=1 Tax=Romanomermis culicivorax TaxID=13658 RepID=A0A915JKB3_ROMCU
MEIVDSNNQILANFEVFHHLSGVRRSIKRQQDSSQRGLSTVVYEALKYFDNTTTAKCDYDDEENLRQFSAALETFALTKSETLQILNLRPTNAIEIQLIVEECEERLTEQQVDDLINLIEKYIPLKANDKADDNSADIENGDQ